MYVFVISVGIDNKLRELYIGPETVDSIKFTHLLNCGKRIYCQFYLVSGIIQLTTTFGMCENRYVFGILSKFI